MQKKRVVFYGRVSTQSDEQISALGNQMTWYDSLLMMHPDWVVVGKYEDAGITGTSVRKRKGFQKMLEDGITFHKYDMIVTRETKRFARNTVDALSYVRLLKQHGIEVYFVSDAIHTISDNDGELRLSIMATIAQEESRKTSENVRAGQRISRQKGILRGTGNILGYRRTGKNQYEIDTEQALIVKKIYEWYLEGDGIRVIKGKLEEGGHKTATGKSCWQLQAIDNILKNPFYTGKQKQLGMVSDGYLTQRRVKNNPDKIEYIKGDYEPIISEEMFQEAEYIRQKRYNRINQKGKKESESVWCGKYLCGCGCGTVRRATSRGESAFICHWQHRNGIRKKTVIEGERDICTLKTITEWKLDMVAYYVINDVWKNRGEDIRTAIKIIGECYREESTLRVLEQETVKTKMDRLERRKKNLLDMRADGEITKEEYGAKREEYERELNRLRISLAEAAARGTTSVDYNRKIDSIESALNQILDLSKPKLNREIVDRFVWKMVHSSDNVFELYLHMGNERFGSIGTEEKVIRYKMFEYPEPDKEETILCTKLKTVKFSYEDAVRYRAMSGRKVLKNKWEDMEVYVYI